MIGSAVSGDAMLAAVAGPAYVIADGDGACVDATERALELLGTDRDTLRLLRVGDLSKPETPDTLTRQLVACYEQVGTWLTGQCEILRPDGSTLPVRFGTIRLRSGVLAARFEPLVFGPDRRGPRDALDAWRTQELAIAATASGTREHLFAELEALWLGAEYQRLAIARASSDGGRA